MADISHGADPVGGDTPHDAVDSGRPIKIGGKSKSVLPTAVSAGNRVDAWFDRYGRLVVLPGHTQYSDPVSVAATASGTTTVIANVASSNLYICTAQILNAASTTISVALKEGSNVRWRGTLAANGGGANIFFGPKGWKLSTNTALNVELFAAGDIRVNITEHYVELT